SASTPTASSRWCTHRDPWRDQLDRNQRGEVPGRDPRVDPVRLAKREDSLVRILRRDDRRLHPLHVLGGDAEVLCGLVDVAEVLGGVRLALLEGQLPRKILTALADQVGDRVAGPRPFP